MTEAADWNGTIEVAKAIAARSPDGRLSPQDTNELISAISQTQGKLAYTETLIGFFQRGLKRQPSPHHHRIDARSRVLGKFPTRMIRVLAINRKFRLRVHAWQRAGNHRRTSCGISPYNSFGHFKSPVTRPKEPSAIKAAL